MAPKHYLKVRELSEFMGVNANTIYRWVRTGKLPCLRKKGLLVFDVKALNRWFYKKTGQRL